MRAKTTDRFLIVELSLFFAASFMPASVSGLPSLYKKWLDEEVIHIISPLEREVFLKLSADRERDLIIEAFWEHRDSTPSMPERGDWDKAIETFSRTIFHHRTNIIILNALGECYFQRGNVSAALPAWQKSSEINPDQPQIRKNIEALRGKNGK